VNNESFVETNASTYFKLVGQKANICIMYRKSNFMSDIKTSDLTKVLLNNNKCKTTSNLNASTNLFLLVPKNDF
jgi:hypothetical protein